MGKTYTKKEKAAALKRLKAGESVSAVSRETNIPRTTLIGWKKATDNGRGRVKKNTQARELTSTGSTGERGEIRSTQAQAPLVGMTEGEIPQSAKTPSVGKADSSLKEGALPSRREPIPPSKDGGKETEQRKEAFSEKSWSNIDKAQEIISKRLNRALDYESAIDELVKTVLDTSDKDLSYQQKQSLLNKLKKIRVDDVRELVVLIGTLYDKQALANKEATSVVEGGLTVEFNIPRPKINEGEDES